LFARRGHDISDIHIIVLTHGHTDHIAEINAVRRFCKPRVFLLEECLSEATDPERQKEAVLHPHVRRIAPSLKHYDILKEFNDSCGEWVLEKEELLPIRDGNYLNLEKYCFKVIRTPGHDIGLTVFYEPKIKLLLSADLLCAFTRCAFRIQLIPSLFYH